MVSFLSPDSSTNDKGYCLMSCLLRIHSAWKKLKENMIKTGTSVKSILYKAIFSCVSSCINADVTFVVELKFAYISL